MKKLLTLILLIYCANLAFGQKANPLNWMASANQMPGNLKAFQENKGQFKNLVNDWSIAYGANCNGTQIMFTAKGVLYYLPERVKMTNEEAEDVKKGEPQAQKEQETENEIKYKTIYHTVAVEWENANTTPVIEPMGKTSYYFGNIDADKAVGIDNIKGFKKLVYHNVYPGVDIEFTFHPDKGIKYTIKVKPGYSASVFKMRYLGQDGLNLDENGNIHIETAMGDIIDHAPATMQNGKQVNSAFQKVADNEIAFNMGASDMSYALVIDPWIVFPILLARTVPMDIGMDAANNVYILEWDSTSAMYIQKYLSTGALSWTYSLSQYGHQASISDMSVDPSGNTYTPQSYYYSNAGGGTYAMICLSSTGTLKYFYNTYNDSLGTIFETWGTAYSPVTGNLIECGAPTILSQQIGIINSTNGKFLGPLHLDTLFDEICAVTIGSNGVMYGVTANKCFCHTGAGSYTNTLVAYNISGVTPLLIWSKRIPTYNFEDFQFKNNAGMPYNGIGTGAGFIYTSNGLTLYQFDINTGALLDSARIPGGDTGKIINSGIAVDSVCDFVYVGSRTDVQVYTTSLIPVTTFTCPGIVNDVVCGNGLVSACGSTSSVDSSFVVQFNAETCLDGVSEINKPADNGFEVYPNPSNGIFNVVSTLGRSTLAVYDLLGQRLINMELTGNQSTVSLDMSDYPKGIYCIRLSNSRNSLVKRIIKE